MGRWQVTFLNTNKTIFNTTMVELADRLTSCSFLLSGISLCSEDCVSYWIKACQQYIQVCIVLIKKASMLAAISFFIHLSFHCSLPSLSQSPSLTFSSSLVCLLFISPLTFLLSSPLPPSFTFLCLSCSVCQLTFHLLPPLFAPLLSTLTCNM